MNLKGGTFLVTAILIAVALDSHALGLRLLDFMPAKHFTQKDWSLAKTSADKALEQGQVDQVFTWLNETANHKGAYKVLSILEVDGHTCRDLYVRHVTRDYKGSGSYRFCKMDDGEWKTTGRTPDNQ